MKKIINILLVILLLMPTAYSAEVEPDCITQLTSFLETIDEEYDSWELEHLSSPEFSTDLLDASLQKFNAYSRAIKDEVGRYRARISNFTLTEVELLTTCNELANNHINARKESLRRNFKSGARDRTTLRMNARWKIITTRMRESLHPEIAKVLGLLQSFADRVPCYTKTCTK